MRVGPCCRQGFQLQDLLSPQSMLEMQKLLPLDDHFALCDEAVEDCERCQAFMNQWLADQRKEPA